MPNASDSKPQVGATNTDYKHRSASLESLRPCSALKTRQSSKIQELRRALVEAGFFNLSSQAQALGLSRSTTWVIINGKYKNTGLSAKIIKRILEVPNLPVAAKATLLEYAQEKADGLYGHSKTQRLNFAEKLSCLHPESVRRKR